jgi:adenylate kinase
MDGYPRTLAQAKAFDAVLKELGLPITNVILLLVGDEEILRRVTGRWSCPAPNCKRTYHVTSNPPKRPGFCDADNTPLVQREDDTVATLSRRLGVYHQNTVELIPYYVRQGLVRDVEGQESIEQIYQTIKQVLHL